MTATDPVFSPASCLALAKAFAAFAVIAFLAVLVWLARDLADDEPAAADDDTVVSGDTTTALRPVSPLTDSDDDIL